MNITTDYTTPTGYITEWAKRLLPAELVEPSIALCLYLFGRTGKMLLWVGFELTRAGVTIADFEDPDNPPIEYLITKLLNR